MDKAKFWNKIAKGYAASKISDPEAYARKLAETQAILRPDMRMVEFGCGTGGTAIAHAPHVAHVQAVDLSQAMLDIAAGKIAKAGISNITLQCAEIESAGFAPESADIVLAMSLLHLLADHNAALARIYTMLKPGGYFVSSTVCISKWNLPIRAALPLMRLFGKAPLVRYFTPQGLLDDFAQAGFEPFSHWQPGRGKAMFAIMRKPGG
ncbi:MAG: class I SAM-dependent methyltransferase [Paracoccaceae bacterium]